MEASSLDKPLPINWNRECYMKKYSFIVLLGLVFTGLLFVFTTPAAAHKVNVFAYAEGDTVYTESYFPDGRRVEGGKVEVYDSQGKKLLEGVTSKEGIFDFKIPKVDDLKIVLIATMGHENTFTIYADELPQVAGATTSAPAQVQGVTPEPAAAPEATTPAKSKTSVRRHAPKKDPFPAGAVLGGLGFIFGLTSLIMQVTGKKKG